MNGRNLINTKNNEDPEKNNQRTPIQPLLPPNYVPLHPIWQKKEDEYLEKLARFKQNLANLQKPLKKEKTSLFANLFSDSEETQKKPKNYPHTATFVSIYIQFYDFADHFNSIAQAFQKIDINDPSLPQIIISSLNNIKKSDKIESLFPKINNIVNKSEADINLYVDLIDYIHQSIVNPKFNKAFVNQAILSSLCILYNNKINIPILFKNNGNLNNYCLNLKNNFINLIANSNLTIETKEKIKNAIKKLIDLHERISRIVEVSQKIIDEFERKSITINELVKEEIQQLTYDFLSDSIQITLEKPLQEKENYLLLTDYKFLNPLEILKLHYELINRINHSNTHRTEIVDQLNKYLETIDHLQFNEEDKLELMETIIENHIKKITDSQYLMMPSNLKNELYAFLNQIKNSMSTIRERSNKLHLELINCLNHCENPSDHNIDKLRNNLMMIHGYKISQQEYLTEMKRNINNCLRILCLKDTIENKEEYPDLKKKLNDFITEIDKILNIIDMRNNADHTNTIKMQEEEKTCQIEKENPCNVSRLKP